MKLNNRSLNFSLYPNIIKLVLRFIKLVLKVVFGLPKDPAFSTGSRPFFNCEFVKLFDQKLFEPLIISS